MTYRPRRRCRRCDRDRDQAGGMSRSGLCPDCGPIVYEECARQIAERHGPYFDAWRDGLTDWVASLWGASLTPEAATVLAESVTISEEVRWPIGIS